MTTPSPPPGTGGTSLVEELEQAADRAVRQADQAEERWKNGFLSQRAVMAEHRTEAARLRARAARVRELEALGARIGSPDSLRMFNRIAGPLSPTEPAATPAEKGKGR